MLACVSMATSTPPASLLPQEANHDDISPYEDLFRGIKAATAHERLESLPSPLHSMIRTHRPRGHAWTCASVFQQTLDFRHIDLDECQPPDEKILYPDPHDDWTLAERDAKRRRIEKLADDFLDGFELHIHSARLDPQRFRTTLGLSFPRPKDARIAVEEADLPEESSAVWEDVEDDREILRALVSGERDAEESTAIFADDTAASIEQTVVTEVQAQASCGPKRNLRSGRVLAGPSEEALRKAAELRNRRLQRVVLDANSQLQSCPRPVVPETQDQPTDSSICETASDCGPTPTPAWTSSKWIKGSAFQLRKKGVDEDCSKDELGASILTPSQRSRTRSRPLGRAASVTQNQSQDAPPVSSTATDVTGSYTMRKSVPEDEHESFQSAVFVPETSNPSQAASASEAHKEQSSAEQDSQTELLHRQGVYVALRKSWVAVNNSHADSESAEPTRKPSTSRKAKSTGGTAAAAAPQRASPRRRSAPQESQNQDNDTLKPPADQIVNAVRSRIQYTAVAVNGASPLLFRKRTSRSNGGETPDTAPLPVASNLPAKTPRRHMLFPSTDTPQQPAPTPRTPLADEHLNKILPRGSEPGRHSSTTRRALRDELRASGAEISRCADDPSSSQREATSKESPHRAPVEDLSNANGPATETELAPEAQVESQPPWPGTQDQLAQAYRNLFTSPDKSDTALYSGEKSTPGGATEASKLGRQPIRQLSQEPMPMPSTQALLDGWEGWSSVKKPRPAGKRPSLVQSPTVGKGQTMISSDPAQSMEAANRRRSSLRFSMSTADSPEKPRSNSITSLPSPQCDPPQPEKDSSGFLRPAPRRSSGGITSSLSFCFSNLDLPTSVGEQKQSATMSKTLEDLSFGQTMSSVVQQAQRQPDLDSQELDFTITQIAEDVLRTGVEGVMGESQGTSF